MPSPNANNERSQPLLRLPKNQTPAEVTLHDGVRAQVLLFIAPGEHVAQLFDERAQFVPMSFGSGTRLVARTSIAAISVHVLYARLEDELPGERQNVEIMLVAGGAIKGELRWIAPEGRRRTLDHLNSEANHIVAHQTDHVVYVAKDHIATVEEA